MSTFEENLAHALSRSGYDIHLTLIGGEKFVLATNLVEIEDDCVHLRIGCEKDGIGKPVAVRLSAIVAFEKKSH